MLLASSVAAAVAGLVVAGVLLGRGQAGAPADRTTGAVTLAAAAGRPRLPVVDAPTLIPPPARLALAELRGRPLFVSVWASWCTVCRKEAPALSRLARRYGAAVRFVGIDTNDTRSAALAFVRRYRLSFPHLLDPKATIAGRLGVFGVPTTFLVDRRGRIAATLVGRREPRVLESYLRMLAADRG